MKIVMWPLLISLPTEIGETSIDFIARINDFIAHAPIDIDHKQMWNMWIKLRYSLHKGHLKQNQSK